ncbi:hypothetical protein C8R43DRAFT_980438 [Mycena crocata]|nr:hypothetical protein C8R43DRAFT_980438 [Mycena crocata]
MEVYPASVSSIADFDHHPGPNVHRSASNGGDLSLSELLRDFKSNCQVLERQLEMFSSSVRQLGSSLGLYKGSREFQRQLSSVRRLLEDESQIELLVNKPSNEPQSSYYPTETWVHKDLWLLVDAIGVFSTAWDDFPEFADNDRRHCLVTLEQHLLVWLNILGSYEYSPEFLHCVQELLFDTISELGQVTRRLADFIATGVQEISFAQKHSTQILMNSATIATFFSAVTVTTIQYSVTAVVDSPLLIAVNTLWFSSLVLSVSSAINSLLAMTWRQAIYSTPQRRVPWWVRIWFKQTPIVLLSMSVLSFLAGLLCYIFLTQDRVTKIVVSALTGVVGTGLGSISFWFAWERWDFARLRRTLWIQEVHEKLEDSWGMFFYDYLMYLLSWVWIWKPTPPSLPIQSSPQSPPRIPSIPESMVSRHTDGSVNSENRRGRVASRAHRGHDPTSVVGAAAQEANYSDDVFPEFTLQRTLKVGQSDDVVRHVQFSTKGTWFAACTRSVCSIYQVKPYMRMHQTLKHTFGQIRQLEWSPDEKRLLIRVSGGIELWELKQNKLENRQKEWMGKVIKKVQWMNNIAFLALTEDGLIQFKINNESHLSQERTIAFESGLYFAVVPPRNCVLVIAGHKSRVHEEIRFPKRTVRSIRIHHLDGGKLLYSFPLLRDARWISVASDGLRVLLGFGNQQAPELWSFEGCDDRMLFVHRFASSAKDRFSGPPHFVGSNDEFVACATSNGSIRVWKRDENGIVGSLAMTADHEDPRKRDNSAIPMMTWNPGTAMVASAAAEVNLWAPDARNMKEERERCSTS